MRTLALLPFTVTRAVWRRLSPRWHVLIVVAALAGLGSWAADQWTAQHLTRVPGLPGPRRPVTVVQVSPDTLLRRATAAQRAALTPQARCRRNGLRHLGFIAEVEPSLALRFGGVPQAVGGSLDIGAVYVTGTDTIYTRDRMSAEVRHEVVHALDDQHGDRMQRAVVAPTTDESVALRAAIEGTAVATVGGPTLALGLGGNLDYNAWLVAYVAGPAYVRHLTTRGAAPFAARPRTTQEVLFPGMAPSQTRSIPTTPLLAGESLECSDRLGALGVLTAVTQSGAPAETRTRLPRAWADDRLDVIAGPSGPRVVWSVVFRDSAAAAVWRSGPGAQIHLTAPRTAMLTLVDSVAQPPAPFATLGQEVGHR